MRNICKFIDEKVRLVINDPATGEWQIYLNDWRMPFKAESFTAAIKLAMGAK